MKFHFISKIYKYLKSSFAPAKKIPFVYVALGDSTTEGVGASTPQKSFPALVHAAIRQEFKKAKYYNLGKRGARVSDVLSEQAEVAIGLRPNLITISVGANDIRGRVGSKKFREDLSNLIAKLKTETNGTIVVNNIPDFTSLPSLHLIIRLWAKISLSRFNLIIREQAKKYRVAFVDLHTQSKLFSKNYPEFVSADGFHPSDSGYALWANSLISRIRELIISQKLRAV